MYGHNLKSDMRFALELAKIINPSNIREVAREIVDQVESEDDYTIEADGEDWRCIHEDAIERIHDDSIRELVDDCYLSDKNIPDVIKNYFDYEKFARDCRISDGYGHHFASYDGEKHEIGDCYLFRIN